MEKEFQIHEDETGQWILISAFRLRLGDEIKQHTPDVPLKDQSSFDVHGLDKVNIAAGVCPVTNELTRPTSRFRLTVCCNPGSWHGYIYPAQDIMTTIGGTPRILSRGWEKVWLKVSDAS